MAKKWDRLMKMLVGANTQHFVNWLVEGAQFTEEMARELTARAIEADLLFKVILENGLEEVLHGECQRNGDEDMGKRLWEYNIIASFLAKVPVLSFLIYLKKTNKVITSPYEHKSSTGEVIHRFYFTVIKLWEIPGEVFKQPGREGLLPLLPLTRNGVRHKVVEEMVALLQEAGYADLLPLGYAFAALVFTKSSQKVWLQRRFAMLEDILEESWAYQEMVNKGMMKGLKQGQEQGLQQGLQQGQIEASQRAVVGIVQARFPEIVEQAQKLVAQASDGEQLQQVIIDMSIARDAQEATHVLLSLSSNG